jgi:hypothetical protein
LFAFLNKVPSSLRDLFSFLGMLKLLVMTLELELRFGEAGMFPQIDKKSETV